VLFRSFTTANGAIALWPVAGQTGAILQRQVATAAGDASTWEAASSDLAISPITYLFNLAPAPVEPANATPTPQVTAGPHWTPSVDVNGVVTSTGT